MNKQLPPILTDFEQFLLEIKCIAPTSAEQRVRHMREFNFYLNGKPFSKTTLQDVYNYVRHLKNKDRTYHSRYSIH